MGGPCTIKPPAGATGAAALKRRAPPCTDNFHLAPFTFDGAQYHSVEQAYQACKFPRGSAVRARLARLAPTTLRRTTVIGRAFGLHAWHLGQAHPDAVRADWAADKVRVMYECNLARYKAHPNLRDDLLSTAGSILHGPHSTRWTHGGQKHTWQQWNGWIQMRIREELRDPSVRDAALLAEMVARFDAYSHLDGGGGGGGGGCSESGGR